MLMLDSYCSCLIWPLLLTLVMATPAGPPLMSCWQLLWRTLISQMVMRKSLPLLQKIPPQLLIILLSHTGRLGLYDPRYHPNHRENAHCTLCFADISIKWRTTSGLKRHLQSRNREQFESINYTASTSSETTGQRSISHSFPKAKNMNDIHTEYVHAVTNFIIAKSQPFTIVASPEFRGLFHPFHKEANKITEVSSHQLREEIFTPVYIFQFDIYLSGTSSGKWHSTRCNHVLPHRSVPPSYLKTALHSGGVSGWRWCRIPIHSLSRCRNTLYIYDMNLWSTPSGVQGSTMM
jgi:hypothetical protein